MPSKGIKNIMLSLVMELKIEFNIGNIISVNSHFSFKKR